MRNNNCCARWRTNRCVGILNEMSPDDRTALLEEMPSAAARQLIQLLTPEERNVAHAITRLSGRQRRPIR